MYIDVAEELKLIGFPVTPLACKRKYGKLLSRYKVVKDHNSKTGEIYGI